MSNLQVIRIKDIETLLKVSTATAQRYYHEIKETYSIKIVLQYHFNKYFNIK